MAVKKRCGFCNKHLVNVGAAENPKWVCKNEKCPRYVPEVTEEERKQAEPAEEVVEQPKQEETSVEQPKKEATEQPARETSDTDGGK